MYRVEAASVTHIKMVKGYQALLMNDKLGAPEFLMLGDGDVIFGKMDSEEYGQICNEEFKMLVEGRSRE